MLDTSVGATTHPGTHRELNEDSVLVIGSVAAVADGMGGHAAGEVASKIAVTVLARLSEYPTLRREDVVTAIGDANSEILASTAANPAQAGMGTTLAGVAAVQFGGSDHWAVFNVGDSRVYRYADGRLTQVTVDHSEVAELVAAGVLTSDEARTYPRRNVVTRSLGIDPAPEADIWVFPPVPGERFLICSDGLPLELSDDSIAEILRTEKGAQQACDALVSAAVAAGGRDNVSAVVLDLLSEHAPGGVDGDTAPRVRIPEEP